MANPKRKHSKARKNKRRSHHALIPVQLTACPQCGKPRQTHRVCSACGHYAKGVKVIDPEKLGA